MTLPVFTSNSGPPDHQAPLEIDDLPPCQMHTAAICLLLFTDCLLHAMPPDTHLKNNSLPKNGGGGSC